MKKSINILGEAGFAVCFAIAAVIALLLMLGDALWKTTAAEFSFLDSRFEKLKKGFQMRMGWLASPGP